MAELDPNDPEMRELLDLFKDEGLERLGKVARSIEGLAEAAPDARAPLLDEIDRELHTLKGSARMLGFAALGKLVHETEGLARAIRRELTPNLRELLVETADRLVALINQCAKKGEDATDESLEARVRTAAGPTPTKKSPIAAKPLELDAPAPGAPGASSSDQTRISGSFLEPEHATSNVWRLTRRLTPDAMPRAQPAFGADPDKPTAAYSKGKLEGKPEKPPTAAPQARPTTPAELPPAKPHDTRALPRDLVPSPPKEKEKDKHGTTSSIGGQKDDETDLVRVRGSKLAQLDGFVSELSLARLRLDAFEDRLRALAGDLESRAEPPENAGSLVRRLARVFREERVHLARTAKGLERLAIDVRLRPVGRIFDSLPKEARDLARRLGKKIRTRIKGAQTELDRAILDGVKDPLLHIIRNTIDHGIESPEERLAAGKPEEGLIDIEAAQDGGSVLITVRDDGRGIDAEKVRAAAIRKGVISPENARRMAPDEVIELVFVPGFSTRDQVTDISGRGVGLDVVKRNVEQLKGEVRIRTSIGQGTEIGLKLPLTVLVSRVLFFRAGETLVGIPTSSVEATAIVGGADMGSFEGIPTVRHRGRSVPVARVTQLLGLPTLPRDQENGHAHRLAIVRHTEDALALSVTAFEGERSVVVKPLGWPLEHVRGTAGAVILGTGETALLLHVPDLFSLANELLTAPEPQPAAITESARRRSKHRRVLVVDDSVITRQLEKRILEGLGFDVEVAVDGQDALRFLERGHVPDVVITDVEMPRLDGLGLVRRMRRENRTKEVPVVIVSTRGAAEDRRAGLEAGADAYIVKSEFDEKMLRETIERLLG